MTHDQIFHELDKLIGIYEREATRLAEIDAFDDDYWPVMRQLRVVEMKIGAFMEMATAPIDRWFAARDQYLASNNRAEQSSEIL